MLTAKPPFFYCRWVDSKFDAKYDVIAVPSWPSLQLALDWGFKVANYPFEVRKIEKHAETVAVINILPFNVLPIIAVE